MFFINILLVLHSVSFRLIDSINSKLTISLYLNDKYDKDSIEISDLERDIKEKLPNIKYLYRTKEEILKDMEKKDPELVKILERVNPLPETIVLSSIDLEQYEELNHIIENKLFILSNVKDDNKDYFSNYTTQYEKIVKVIHILDILQKGLYVIIGVFIISIAIIIYSIIGNFIYYFKEEISITRLVGGSKLFIYGPFSLQGIIYSIISFIFSILVFLFFLKNLELLFDTSYSLDFLSKNIYLVFTLELGIFIFIGGFSGFLSSRRYLK